MRTTSRILMTAALAASSAWLGGCLLGTDGSGPSAEQKKQSADAAAQGSGQLGSAVAGMTSSQYRYGKEDLTQLKASQAKYAEAARLNPGNSQAQLGLALTNILLAAQDPRLADVLNRTVEGKSPFDSKLAGNAPLLRPGVLAKVAEASTWPEFHEIQDSIEKVLLPALEDAIARVKIAYDDPNFSMTLTIDGTPRELDHVEAGILLAGLHALHGLATLWLSRDIDIDYNGSYAWIEALQGLDSMKNFSDLTDAQRDALKKGTELLGPNAPFLTVRPAWKDRLSKVDDEINASLDILRESLGSMAKETDARDDDLIHLCGPFEEGSCLSPADYQNALNVVDTARKYMNQPYALRLGDIDTTIQIDFSAYFRVQDYKKMLPYYGFYDPQEWSDAKPALYFTDNTGKITGDVMTLKRIAEDSTLGPVQTVERVRAVIHFQDPTFQGFLPGATEDDIWNLLRKRAKLNEQRALDDTTHVVLIKRSAVSTLRPDFALGLTGILLSRMLCVFRGRGGPKARLSYSRADRVPGRIPARPRTDADPEGPARSRPAGASPVVEGPEDTGPMDPARFRATGPGSALRGPAASLLVLIHLGILGARPVHAEGDPFEDALGMDYARQLLPTPDAPRPAVGALPGFSGAFPFARSPLPGAGSDPSGRARSGAPDTSRIPAANRSPGQAPIPLACAQDAREPSDSVRPARLEVSATAWQRDLIRREARFSFAHRRSDAAFDFAWSALPGLELRFAADRDRQELSLGDTAANANADGADWGWRAAVSFPLTPLLIPSAVVGARSSDPEGDALEALAFRGAAPGGLSWSLAWGRRRRDYPVGLKLPEYAPLSLPFLLRQDFAEAGLSWVRGGWDLSWSGSRARARPPAIRPPGYSLDDSATVWRQEARAAYARDALAAALDFDLGAGRHVFRGLSRRDGTVYPFSWQQGKQMDYAVRADISARLRRGAAGAWLAAGESEYDAVRPDQAYGRWFWDRNGVIDSYQGSLLGLFSGETWLMNGAVYAGHAGIGVWWRSAWAGFAYRAAAGYQYLILQADSHLSRRRTEFLLGYTQEDQDRTYPTVEADLLPVSLGLTRSWGNLFVTAGGQAALPLRIRVERAGSGGAGTGGGGADYGGGAVAGIRLGYRLP